MQEKIKAKCDEIRDLLVKKNEAYGNAVFEKGVLFDVEPLYAIQARINDKLNRIKNNNVYHSDNDLLDLTGYLILLQIMKEDMDAKMEWNFNNNVNGKSNEERA
jgi:heat shock protein HspQ